MQHNNFEHGRSLNIILAKLFTIEVQWNCQIRRTVSPKIWDCLSKSHNLNLYKAITILKSTIILALKVCALEMFLYIKFLPIFLRKSLYLLNFFNPTIRENQSLRNISTTGGFETSYPRNFLITKYRSIRFVAAKFLRKILLTFLPQNLQKLILILTMDAHEN